jgi:hypothetical protein
MPMDEIVGYVVKTIALTGSGSDYTGLPEELKVHIRVRMAWYQKSGGWLLVSNDGLEDYGPYADAFLSKVCPVD